MADTLRERLEELAFRYHREQEGEYGCPGQECPGVKRLVAFAEAAAALASPGVPAAQGWQDISTAPKDGTQVWLWWDGKRRLAHWHEAVNPPSIGGRFANWLTEDRGSVSAVTKPTLWHPLPVAPSAGPAPTEDQS